MNSLHRPLPACPVYLTHEGKEFPKGRQSRRRIRSPRPSVDSGRLEGPAEHFAQVRDPDGSRELQTRQDVSLFLREIAQSKEDVTTRGTALLSASRLAVDLQETFGLVCQHAFYKAADKIEQYTARAYAISALSNMYREGGFAAPIRDVLRDIQPSPSNQMRCTHVRENSISSRRSSLRDRLRISQNCRDDPSGG